MAWDPNTNNIYLTDIGFLQYDFRIIDKNSGSSSILGALDPGVAFQENYYDWISFDGTALGLNVFDSLSFKVFPNPTNNMLNIQSKTPIENVKIYSPQGTNCGGIPGVCPRDLGEKHMKQRQHSVRVN